MKRLPLIGLGIVLLMGTTLYGYTQQEKRSVTQAARAFLEAAHRGDISAMEQTMTQRAREQMAATNLLASSKSTSSERFELDSPIIKGESAEIPVRSYDKESESSMQVYLRRENGDWRVYAEQINLKPTTASIYLDFEHPETLIGNAMHGAGQAAGEVIGQTMKGVGQLFQGMGEGMQKGMDEKSLVR